MPLLPFTRLYRISQEQGASGFRTSSISSWLAEWDNSGCQISAEEAIVRDAHPSSDTERPVFHTASRLVLVLVLDEQSGYWVCSDLLIPNELGTARLILKKGHHTCRIDRMLVSRNPDVQTGSPVSSFVYKVPIFWEQSALTRLTVATRLASQ